MRSLVAPIDPPPVRCLDAAERVSVAGYCSTSFGPMPTVNADVTRTSLICVRMQYEFGSPMATVNLLSHVCKVSAYNVGKPNPRMFRMAYERSRSLPRCTLHAARGMLHAQTAAKGRERVARLGGHSPAQPVHGMMPSPVPPLCAVLPRPAARSASAIAGGGVPLLCDLRPRVLDGSHVLRRVPHRSIRERLPDKVELRRQQGAPRAGRPRQAEAGRAQRRPPRQCAAKAAESRVICAGLLPKGRTRRERFGVAQSCLWATRSTRTCARRWKTASTRHSSSRGRRTWSACGGRRLCHRSSSTRSRTCIRRWSRATCKASKRATRDLQS
jgi:hypothetical protein